MLTYIIILDITKGLWNKNQVHELHSSTFTFWKSSTSMTTSLCMFGQLWQNSTDWVADKKQTFIYHSSRDWKFKIRASAWLGEVLLPGGILSLYTHRAALWAFFYRCCQWKWGSFIGSWDKHFRRNIHGRMWYGSEVFWDGNRRLLWVLNVSSSSALPWKKFSLISIKAKTKTIVQRFCAIGPASAIAAPVQVA